MLLYAAEYRDDVVGLVLVDPTPVSTDEEQLAFLSPSEQTEFATLSNDRRDARAQGGLPILSVIQVLQPFGVARLFTDSFLETSVYGRLSSALQPAYRAGINRAAYLSTLSAEMERRATSVDQVRGAGGLGDLPTVVLGSSKPTAFYADALSPELSGRMLELALKMLAGTRQSIARLSSNGRVEAVAQSGHYIQFDRPDAVISTIEKMLAGQSGGTP
jgi:pimeloyl-ACP methyl ester carboxylesterase